MVLYDVTMWRGLAFISASDIARRQGSRAAVSCTISSLSVPSVSSIAGQPTDATNALRLLSLSSQTTHLKRLMQGEQPLWLPSTSHGVRYDWPTPSSSADWNTRLGGLALELVWSYLSGRTSFVKIGRERCGMTTIAMDVPHGTVLGPILFSLFISPLSNVIFKYDIRFHQYADDIHRRQYQQRR